MDLGGTGGGNLRARMACGVGRPVLKGCPGPRIKGDRSRHSLDKPCGRWAGSSTSILFTGWGGLEWDFNPWDDLFPAPLFWIFTPATPIHTHSISISLESLRVSEEA